MHRHLQKRRLPLVNRKDVLLLHYNAKPRIARVTHMKFLPHIAYSPDLAKANQFIMLLIMLLASVDE